MRNRRGILNPTWGEQHFCLTRHEPSALLAPFIERYWVIHWDLPAGAPHKQETLPFPCVNVSLMAGRSAIHGVTTQRFEVLLEGKGQVIGIKFRPGGFYPFVRIPIHKLTDRTLPLPALLGPESAALEARVLALPDTRNQVACVDAFFAARTPARDPEAEHAAQIVDLAQTGASLHTVEQLARRSGVPLRTLQRLFRRYVGVGPKWVLRRFRIHEAAERLDQGASTDLAALAQDLGIAIRPTSARTSSCRSAARPPNTAHRRKLPERLRTSRALRYECTGTAADSLTGKH